MTWSPRTSRFGALALGAVTVLLAGCAGLADAAPDPSSASPSPSYACPAPIEGEPPAGCAPFDPEHAMAQNERYRERVGIDDVTRAEGDRLVGPVTASLEALRTSGAPLTAATVAAALEGSGVAGTPQLREAAGDVLFRVAVGGGCLYGAVEATGVTVEVGGYILDGGCLPAQ